MSRQADSIVVLQLARPSRPRVCRFSHQRSDRISLPAMYVPVFTPFCMFYLPFVIGPRFFFWYSVWQIKGTRKKSCVRDVWSTRYSLLNGLEPSVRITRWVFIFSFLHFSVAFASNVGVSLLFACSFFWLCVCVVVWLIQYVQMCSLMKHEVCSLNTISQQIPVVSLILFKQDDISSSQVVPPFSSFFFFTLCHPPSPPEPCYLFADTRIGHWNYNFKNNNNVFGDKIYWNNNFDIHISRNNNNNTNNKWTTNWQHTSTRKGPNISGSLQQRLGSDPRGPEVHKVRGIRILRRGVERTVEWKGRRSSRGDQKSTNAWGHCGTSKERHSRKLVSAYSTPAPANPFFGSLCLLDSVSSFFFFFCFHIFLLYLSFFLFSFLTFLSQISSQSSDIRTSRLSMGHASGSRKSCGSWWSSWREGAYLMRYTLNMRSHGSGDSR